MNTDKKVGAKTNKPFGGMITIGSMITKGALVVGSVDGITFGIDQHGNTFHTARPDWDIDSQINWATANALYFHAIAIRLDNYALALKNKRKK